MATYFTDSDTTYVRLQGALKKSCITFVGIIVRNKHLVKPQDKTKVRLCEVKAKTGSISGINFLLGILFSLRVLFSHFAGSIPV